MPRPVPLAFAPAGELEAAESPGVGTSRNCDFCSTLSAPKDKHRSTAGKQVRLEASLAGKAVEAAGQDDLPQPAASRHDCLSR